MKGYRGEIQKVNKDEKEIGDEGKYLPPVEYLLSLFRKD